MGPCSKEKINYSYKTYILKGYNAPTLADSMFVMAY